jgi:hypothetical protein
MATFFHFYFPPCTVITPCPCLSRKLETPPQRPSCTCFVATQFSLGLLVLFQQDQIQGEKWRIEEIVAKYKFCTKVDLNRGNGSETKCIQNRSKHDHKSTQHKEHASLAYNKHSCLHARLWFRLRANVVKIIGTSLKPVVLCRFGRYSSSFWNTYSTQWRSREEGAFCQHIYATIVRICLEAKPGLSFRLKIALCSMALHAKKR